MWDLGEDLSPLLSNSWHIHHSEFYQWSLLFRPTKTQLKSWRWIRPDSAVTKRRIFCCNLSPQSNTSLRNWQFFSKSKKQGWRRHLRRLHSDDAETCQPSSSPPRPSSRQADSGVGGRQTGDNLGLSQQAQSHLDFSRHLVVTYFPCLGQLRKSECQITSL